MQKYTFQFIYNIKILFHIRQRFDIQDISNQPTNIIGLKQQNYLEHKPTILISRNSKIKIEKHPNKREAELKNES